MIFVYFLSFFIGSFFIQPLSMFFPGEKPFTGWKIDFLNVAQQRMKKKKKKKKKVYNRVFFKRIPSKIFLKQSLIIKNKDENSK